jgi:dCMP deaminase
MGAVVVKKNKVIGMGFNKIKTHPKSNHPQKMIHAELDAILDCSEEDLIGADLYVFREYKNGEWACAKPCKHCQELISLCGVKNVFYTDEGALRKL